MAIAPVSSAMGVLAAGLSGMRARADAAARSIAADPLSPDAIVDLSVSSLGMRAMAVALRTVEETQGDLVDVLA